MSKISKDTWKAIIQLAIAFLTALATAFGVQACGLI